MPNIGIKAIVFEEPHREGEYPEGAHVGFDGVTAIVQHRENFGDYALLWFDVLKGRNLVKRFNGRHVAVITYFETPTESPS